MLDGIDKAVSDLKSTTNEANKSSTALGKIGTVIKNVFGNNKTEAFGVSLEKLTSRVSTQQNKVELLKQKYADLYLTHGKNSDEAKEVAEEIEKLSKELVENRSKLSEAEAAANEFDESLEDAGDEADEFGEKSEEAAEKSSSAFSNFASVVGKTVVKSITAATTAIGAVVGYSVKVGADFEEGMSKVAAISGATGDDLEALTEKAKEMGAKTKFSATESAEAFEYMAMAGWKTEDMLNGIEGVMNLAAASGEELGEVSDIVTDALTAMGLTAEDTNHFVDVLAAASSNSNTNVAMMGETFKYAAPLAGALGYSIEDTAQAIGLMANAGIKGGQAGTSLRAILTRLANPTDECAAVMDKYGISLTNADGSMKSLDDVMLDMRSSLQGLSADEQAAAATAIGGQEALSGLLAIVNAADEDVDKLSNAIDNADGAAQSMADTMNDNLKGKITILKSAAEGFGITLYEQFSGKAQGAVETLTDAVSRLTEAFQSGGFDGLIEEFGVVFSELITSISSKLPVIIESGLQLIRALGQGLIDAIPELIPVAVEAILTITTGLLEMLPEITQAAIEILAELASGLAAALPNLIPTVVSIILEMATTLTDPDNLSMLINSALSIIIALANGLVASLPQLIAQAPVIISNLVTAIIENVPQLLMAALEIIVSLVTGIGENLGQMGEAAGEIITSLVNGIGGLFESVVSIGSQIVDKIKEGISAAWAGLTSFFSGLWNSLFGNRTVNVGVSASGTAVNGSHASGLDYVPYDGYIAELHRGEMVVPAAESNFLRSSGITSAAEKQNAAIVGLLGQILDAVRDVDMDGMTLDLNRREFGRLVRAVI